MAAARSSGAVDELACRPVVAGTPGAEDRFRRIPHVDSVTREHLPFTIRGRGNELVTEVIQCLAEHDMRVIDFRTERPTLEDVFLKLSRTASWKKYLEDNQFEDGYQNAAELAKFYDGFTATMRGILQEAGIKTVR